MKRLPLLRSLILGLSLALGSTAALAQRDSLRPEVGKPLQEAQKLIQSKKFKQALPAIDEAEKVGKLTEYERFVIAQMRGAAYAGAGDAVKAAAAFEQVLDSGRLPAGEAQNIAEATVGTYFRAKDYPNAVRWIDRYRELGGSKPQVLSLLPQAHYLAGDYAKAAQVAAASITETEKAGGKPDQTLIKILAASAQKSKDNAGYTRALLQLVRYYPSPEYWSDVIVRTSNRPGFSRNLDLDTYRLMRATGNLDEAQEYMEAIQLAVQAGLPGEAKNILDEGFQKKVLGVGDAAAVERQTRLKNLVEKRYADDRKTIAETDAEAAAAAGGDPLVKTGMAYVTYGDAAKGLPMMEQGIAKGGLKYPEQSKLQLGYAYYLAGEKAKAFQHLRTVKGDDGSADLARLWMVLSQR